MRRSLALAVVLVAVGCGGGEDGAAVFERAQRSLADLQAVRARLVVHAVVPIERTATVQASELPLDRLHLARWAKHPRPFACGHGFECARADLDVDAAARELEPVLPSLPVEPASIDSAKIEVRLDSRGALRRVDLDGELQGADLEVTLEPA